MQTRNTERHVPPSVWAALAAILLVVIVQIALAAFVARAGAVGWGMYAFAALLGAILLTGLVRRSRLAWVWGRHLTLIMSAVLAVRLGIAAAQRQVAAPVLAIMILGFVLPLAVAAFALTRPSAYAYYDLVCPSCGRRSSLGADFLFRKARCRKCDQVW